MARSAELQVIVAASLLSVVAALGFLRKKSRDAPPRPLPADFAVTPGKVLAAAGRVKPHVHKTPVLTSKAMDALAGRAVRFKCEVLQKTGSFKIRGATNAALLASDATSPLVTHSSGNHAQALALAARQLGRAAHVVMPDTAPAVKKAAVEGYGAAVTLCEPTNAARAAAASAKARDVGGVFVHPSDDPDVIAGQGTVAVEFLDQCRDLDVLVVPVGGGGLIAGMTVYAKWRKPSLIVVGAEPAAVDDAARSKAAGKLLDHGGADPDTVADGLKTLLGTHTWPVVRDLVDRVITVDEDSIKAATKLVWGRMKLCVEPSAGVGVACVLGDAFKAAYPAEKYTTVGVVLCGGNLDLAKAAKVLF